MPTTPPTSCRAPPTRLWPPGSIRSATSWQEPGRYPSRDAGYNPVALARFAAETGRADVPAPDDAQWGDWRRAQTRGLLERIRAAVAEVAPDTAISAAVIAQGEGPHGARSFAATRAYADYFQDWPAWTRDGLLDLAVPMDYFDDVAHPDWFRQWADFAAGVADDAATASGARVAIGLGAFLNAPASSLDQLGHVGDRLDGAVLYSYQQTADGPIDGLLDLLQQDAWSQPAPAPALR